MDTMNCIMTWNTKNLDKISLIGAIKGYKMHQILVIYKSLSNFTRTENIKHRIYNLKFNELLTALLN